MLIIGSHVSFSKDKQLLGSVEESLGYGSNTFMFYTGAPQNTNRVPINDGLTFKALELMKNNNIDYSKVVVHAPYIINLANNKDVDKYKFSIRFLTEEVERCGMLGIKNMVLHPGSHVGLGVDIGIDNIINGLNTIIENTDINGSNVRILLETMAGKGSEVGSNFDEISRIISGINNKNRIGVCMDTCHMHDSGYDVSDFDALLDLFDEKVGLNYLGCIHINDSKNLCGARKDRHENIGFGYIGFDNLINIIYNPRIESIPKILETPWIGDFAPYKEEIEMIRNKEFDPDLKEKIIDN